MNEVFAGTKDYDKAMARRATPGGAGGIVRNQKPIHVWEAARKGRFFLRPPTRLGLLQ